jgi:hypothetical protein
MASLAELEREFVLARRQRQLRFGLRVAEMARRFAAGTGPPSMIKCWCPLFGAGSPAGFKAIPCGSYFTVKGLMMALRPSAR